MLLRKSVLRHSSRCPYIDEQSYAIELNVKLATSVAVQLAQQPRHASKKM
jgi:hypothetical protein